MVAGYTDVHSNALWIFDHFDFQLKLIDTMWIVYTVQFAIHSKHHLHTHRIVGSKSIRWLRDERGIDNDDNGWLGSCTWGVRKSFWNSFGCYLWCCVSLILTPIYIRVVAIFTFACKWRSLYRILQMPIDYNACINTERNNAFFNKQNCQLFWISFLNAIPLFVLLLLVRLDHGETHLNHNYFFIRWCCIVACRTGLPMWEDLRSRPPVFSPQALRRLPSPSYFHT